MKKIKHSFSILLISLGMILVGELYTLQINNFTGEFSYITMYLQKDTTEEEMIADIEATAKKRQVDVFVTKTELNNLFSEDVHIYGTGNFEEHLNQKANIKAGEYKSLLLGDISISINPLAEISDITQFEFYYLIGSDANILEFRKDLINKYAGKFPVEGNSGHESRNQVIMIWSIIFSLLLLLTFYQITLTKKEIMLQVIYGEKLSQVFIKEMLTDLLIYTFSFSGILYLIQHFTEATYLMPITLACFIVFLLLNTLSYLMLLNMNIKKTLQTIQHAQMILNMSYLYKVVSLVLLLVFITINISSIKTSVSYYQQKAFFKEHKDYDYVMLNNDDFEVTEEINFSLYQDKLTQSKTKALVDLSDWDSTLDTAILYADANAVSYLAEHIPTLQDSVLKDQIYFLLPQKMENNESVKNNLHEFFESVSPDAASMNYDYLFYNNRPDIIGIVKGFRTIESTLYKEPIIILNNIKGNQIPQLNNILYVTTATLMNISDEEWDSYVATSGADLDMSYKTNAYDNYLYQWQFAKRSLISSLFLVMIFILLESLIIRFVIKYEYTVNAMELTLKKVVGHTFIERYRRLFIVTGVTGILAMIGAGIFVYVSDYGNLMDVLLACLLVTLIESILLFQHLKSVEKEVISKVLRGERR